MSSLKSAFSRRVFIAGGHVTRFFGARHPDFVHKRHPDFGKRENPTLEDYLSTAVNGALADANGAPASAVDAAWVGNFVGEQFCNQAHLGSALVGAHPSLRFVPSMRVEGACASGGLAFASAVTAIQAGIDVGLVAGTEVQTTVSAREGGKFLGSASHYRVQKEIDDFVFPALFAMRTRAYGDRWGITAEDLAEVSAQAYEHANRNALAHMHHVKLTREAAAQAGDANPNFLSNPDLKPFIKVSDCSQVSDGGAAAIVCSEQGLRKLGISIDDAVEVLSVGHTTDNLYTEGNLTEMENTREAARRAYEGAGAKPEDIEVAETHDCFSMASVQMVEALGFAAPGEGAQLFRSGDTRFDGRLPINSSGGRIGFGHAVGATGVMQIVEISRQLRGTAGDHQVTKGACNVGITANMGGNDKTSVVSILARR